MKINKYHYLTGILVIIVILIFALLGVWLGSKDKGYRTIAEGIVITNSKEEYNSTMLSTYPEYTDLLNVFGIAQDVFLTAGDFTDNDYIVDYIYYDNDLKIEQINLDITNEGIIINYEVNKNIDSSDEILIYFIPIEKGTISNYKFAKREFKVN